MDDAIDELQRLCKLSELSNDLQRGTHAILMSPGGPGGRSAPAAGYPSGGPVPPHAGGGLPGGANPARGIGSWAKKAIGNWWKGSRIRRGAKTGGRFGAGIGKSLGMGKAGIKGMAGAGAVAGGAAVVITAVVSAIQKAHEAIIKFTDSAMKEAQRLSAVSGSQAALMAERDIQQMMRDVKKGEATAGSMSDLVKAESKRKDQENRIEIAMSNASNSILATLNRIIADVLEPVADAVEFIAKQFGMGDRKIEGVGLGGVLSEATVAAAKRDEAGKSLMDVARAAAAAGRPGPAPMGAARPGGLPMDRR